MSEPYPMNVQEMEDLDKVMGEVAGHAIANFHGELLFQALEAVKHMRQFIWAHQTMFPKKEK